jgi:hypothetical protein
MPDRQRLLELALKGLEAERANIDDEIAQIKVSLIPDRQLQKVSRLQVRLLRRKRKQ